MGFDIYGMDPLIRTDYDKPERPATEVSYHDDLWKDYFKKQREFEKINPGIYFRANVWWWRPIALFLTETMHFLSEEDIKGLGYNDSHIIDADKAKRIGQRIRDMHEIGAIDAWVRDKKIAIVMIPKETCTLCEGTGVRTDKPMFGELEPYTQDGVEGVKCNGCEGIGKREPWESNYPYDTNIILEFGVFAEESGGFQIS